MKRMQDNIREWKLPRQTSVSLNELARRYNATMRGWMNYYGHFYKSAMRRVFDHFDRRLLSGLAGNTANLRGRPRLEPSLAGQDGQPTPSVVRPLARPWKSPVRTMGAV